MISDLLDSQDASLLDIKDTAPGPQGRLPITAEMLLQRPSGDLFGWRRTPGWAGTRRSSAAKEFLILSTHGGIRAADGTPIALGYHTGHWEVGLLMEAAAKELKSHRRRSVRGATAPTRATAARRAPPACSIRLPYRNDAAIVFRRLIRSLPTRGGVIGVATCDKGLPAMMMALAGTRDLPCVLVPGGVTLLAEEGEDAGKVQIVGARFAHGQITLRRCGRGRCAAPARRPGGGCQFLGRRRRRRWSARRSACRCRIPRSRLPAIRSGSTWRGAPAARRLSTGSRGLACATS